MLSMVLHMCFYSIVDIWSINWCHRFYCFSVNDSNDNARNLFWGTLKALRTFFTVFGDSISALNILFLIASNFSLVCSWKVMSEGR